MRGRWCPMVEGVGIDVVEIPRMARTIGVWGEAFLGKVFTVRELSYSKAKRNPTHHFAARFAVKEAVAKAISTGWASGFRWKDVEVENNAAGKPSVVLYGRVRELLKDSRVLVSISHSENVVVACAIIER
jgi:holo-[acyl-carrier protein] synthase